jgi:hypothetical protein
MVEMSNSVTVYCQRFVIENSGVRYPYFLGAADPKELLKVSEAPSFAEDTPHQSIASEVLEPPTKHWQRPIMEENVEKIARNFDQPGELMPNPVLLAVHPDQRIEVVEQMSGSGAPTGLWQIKIAIPTGGNEKPLWIIDGQHRIKGMARTNVVKSPLPFVLLHSNEGNYYPGTLARIFAQVTTAAQPLDSIHQAWMQFAFELGTYARNTNDNKALRTVAILCSMGTVAGKPNPFYSNIQFNPKIEAKPIHPGGFCYDAETLKDLIKSSFFKIQGGEYELTESDLAKEIAKSVSALRDIITKNVDGSAFFGSVGEQKYFRDGYLIGVCHYLLNHEAPADWIQVLRQLKFHETDWDVSNWVNGTSGRAGNVSKKIASKCFQEIFTSGTLPENVDDLCDYLAGKNAYLKLEYQLVDENDEVIARSKESRQIEFGGLTRIIESLPSNARYLRITSPCNNVGPVSIALADKPFDENFQFESFKKGRVLQKNELKILKNKIILKIKADFYGDRTIEKELLITFNA